MQHIDRSTRRALALRLRPSTQPRFSLRQGAGARLLWSAVALLVLALALALAPSIWAQSLTAATMRAYPGAYSANTVVVFTNTSGHRQAFAPEAATISGPDAAAFTVRNGCDALQAAGQACVVYVQFKAPAAGTFSATLHLTFTDVPYEGQSGRPVAITVSAELKGIGLPPAESAVGPELAFAPTRTTFAGTGWAASSLASGPATTVALNGPLDVLPDNQGNVYIADSGDNAVRKVDSSGNLTQVAGTGIAGYSGDHGPAAAAALNHPAGLALDAAGNLYIADTGNGVIRRVDGAGTITTFAGQPLSHRFDGDNGPAADAGFLTPTGMVFDSKGNLYVSDTESNEVRRIDTAGTITAFAGVGGGPFIAGSAGFAGDDGPAVTAQLFRPTYLAVDSTGNLYIADENNSRIRKVTAETGMISTVAGFGGLAGANNTVLTAAVEGTQGQPARLAEMLPSGIALGPSGDLYVADSEGPLFDVSPRGTIRPYGGSATGLVSPAGIAVDAAGALYVADRTSNLVTRFAPAQGLDFGSQPVEVRSPPRMLTLTNTGGAPVVFGETPYTVSDDFAVAQSGSCSFAAQLAPGASCTVGIAFTPTAEGARSGSIGFVSNDPRSPLVAELSGMGLGGQPVAALSPSSLDFGNLTEMMKPSPAMVVTLSNHGSAPLTGIVPTLTGANAALFAFNSGCGATLAPGASCNIAVNFTPRATGKYTATLHIASSGAAQVSALTGTAGPLVSGAPITLTINEKIHTTDAVKAQESTILAVKETIHTRDTPGMNASTLLTIAEKIHIKDSPGVNSSTLLAIAEKIHTKDTPGTNASTLLSIAEKIHTRDAPGTSASTLLAVAETIHTKDAPGASANTLLSITEAIHTKDSPGTKPSSLLTVAEKIHTKDTPGTNPSTLLSVAEKVHTKDSPGTNPSTLLSVTEKIHTKDAPAPVSSTLLPIGEKIHTSDMPGLASPQ